MNGVPKISGLVALLHSAAGEEKKKKKESSPRWRGKLDVAVVLIKAGWKAAGCDCVIWWLTNACCSL